MKRIPIRLGRSLELMGKLEKKELDRALEIQKELNIELGTLALLEGCLTLDAFSAIYVKQQKDIKSFREVALEGRFLTVEQLDQLELLSQQKHIRLGDLLIAAGLVTEEDIRIAMEYDHFS